jgi:hypothetical protein
LASAPRPIDSSSEAIESCKSVESGWPFRAFSSTAFASSPAILARQHFGHHPRGLSPVRDSCRSTVFSAASVPF